MKKAIILFFMLTKLVYANYLSFDDILSLALENSLDIKIAKEAENISFSEKLNATVPFLPQIYAQTTTEFQNDLLDRPTFIKQKRYHNNDQWKSSASLNFDYNIFNGGTDYEKYKIASLEHRIKQIQTKAVTKNTMISLVDTYEQILISYNSMVIYEKMAANALELYNSLKRLYEAGAIDIQQQYLAGVKAADYTTQKLMAEKSLYGSYQELSYYISTRYEIDTVPIDFNISKAEYKIDPMNYPEYRIVMMQMQQNKRQQSINNSELLPSVNAFARYNAYGGDRGHYFDSARNLRADSWQFGIYVKWNLFNGGSYVYRRMSVNAEKRKLELNRQQILKKIEIERSKMYKAQEYISSISEQTETSTKLTNDTLETGTKLREENLISAVQMLNNEIDTLEKTLSQKLIDIKMSADAKRLEITSEFIR